MPTYNVLKQKVGHLFLIISKTAEYTINFIIIRNVFMVFTLKQSLYINGYCERGIFVVNKVLIYWSIRWSGERIG